MLETDIAYVAGLVDGEAYIGIKKVKVSKGKTTPSYIPRIQIRMVDEAAISFIGQLLGGNYYKESSHAAKGRPLFCYAASDRIAVRILGLLLPFLRVKKRQAEVVLKLARFKESGRRHRTKITGYREFPNAYGTVRLVPNLSLSDKFIFHCEEMYQDCKKLNRVGLAALEP